MNSPQLCVQWVVKSPKMGNKDTSLYNCTIFFITVASLMGELTKKNVEYSKSW